MHTLPVHTQGPPFSYVYFCTFCKKKSKEEFEGYWEGRRAAYLAGRRHSEEKHGGRLWPDSPITFRDLDARKAANKKIAAPSKKTSPKTIPTKRVYVRKKKSG